MATTWNALNPLPFRALGNKSHISFIFRITGKRRPTATWIGQTKARITSAHERITEDGEKAYRTWVFRVFA